MIIKLNDLEVVFGNGKEALKVLDIPQWQVEEGDQVAIFGPSGSGKSTFPHVLAGLLPVSKGTLSVCGHSLEGISEAARDRFRAKYKGYEPGHKKNQPKGMEKKGI